MGYRLNFNFASGFFRIHTGSRFIIQIEMKTGGSVLRLRFTVKSKIATSFIVLIVVLLCTSWFNYQSFTNMQRESDLIVTDAIVIRSAAAHLTTDLVNEETGIRGYLVTGNEVFLEPYNLGMKQLSTDLQTIRAHEALHPIMKHLVEDLAVPQIGRIQLFFQSEIDLVKSGHMDEARAKIGDGKAAMDAFRAIATQIQQDNDKLTRDAWNATKQAGHRAIIVIMSSVIASVLFAVFAAIYLGRTIIIPILRIRNQLKEIAEGEGDLTRQIKVGTKDELFDLAESFNQMTEKLRDLIHQVRASAEHVAATAEQLTDNAEHTSKATEHIASSMQEVSSGAEDQARHLNEGAQAVKEMTSGIQQVAANSHRVSTNIQEASERVTEGRASVNTAVQQMENIHQTISLLENVIRKLGQDSESIEQITSTITDISGQTNLLALNAAIEAARAGEHGKGFAVVAEEVRKLAEQSTLASKQISTLIDSIRVQIQEAVASMAKGTDEVQKGITVVSDAGNAFSNLADFVQDVAGQVQEVSAASQEMAAGAVQLQSIIEQINELSKNVSAETQSVSASAEEQLASMEEVTASSKELARLSEELLALVGRFKV
jgi:methyl-accepting chemotaxis protein